MEDFIPYRGPRYRVTFQDHGFNKGVPVTRIEDKVYRIGTEVEVDGGFRKVPVEFRGGIIKEENAKNIVDDQAPVALPNGIESRLDKIKFISACWDGSNIRVLFRDTV